MSKHDTQQRMYHPLKDSLPIIFLCSTVSFFSLNTYATTVIDTGSLTIDSSTPVDDYSVLNGGKLNANGATTSFITAQNQGQLQITGSQTDAISLQQNSLLNLSGSTVFSSTKAGISIFGTAAGKTNLITGSSITSTAAEGLVLTAETLPDGTFFGGTVADVSNSAITGTTAGVRMTSDSTLTLTNSSVTGTAANSSGIRMFSGTVNASNSVITGERAGISINSSDSGRFTDASLTLDGSSVTGKTGPALEVLGGVNANITVQNGSTLSAGNGTLLNVTGNSNAVFTADNSVLTGDIVAAAGSTADVTLNNNAQLTGQLTNVAKLGLNSGGTWNMVDSASVGDVTLNGGTINFGSQGTAFRTLTLASLAGTGGTFAIGADFAAGGADFLHVTGNATGDHLLAVTASGVDPLADSSLHVVQTGGGDAKFSLLGGPVDLGTWSYDLLQTDPNNWYLNAASRTPSPSTRSVLALFNTAPTVWLGELTTLRTRMGEVRQDQGNTGFWMRTYGNKFNVSAASGTEYNQTQRGFTLGADAALPYGDGQWLAGVMAGFSDSDLVLNRGSGGTVKSYYIAPYATWKDAKTGYYFDAVAKVNRFNNEANVQMSDGQKAKGSYSNTGVGGSAEFGKHITLDNDYFVEPYSKLSAVVIQGQSYDLDNGLQAKGDKAYSVLGSVGSTVGRNFVWGKDRVVQPYVRAAVSHEFANNNQVKVNNNTFDNDLSGSRIEIATGMSATLSKEARVYSEIGYGDGKNISQPWAASVGFSYSF
ncbi:MAG: autotransporter outer membrane beta-barrel domain-containing protein [Pseudomonas gingeri]